MKMIIGFKKQFVPVILNGTKIHSIRDDAKNRWKPGTWMHQATGVRTKNYHCFSEARCISIQEFSIRYERLAQTTTAYVIVDKKTIGRAIWINCALKYSSSTIDELAKKDGFDSVNEFFEWFDDDYKGKIIHWTDFKY